MVGLSLIARTDSRPDVGPPYSDGSAVIWHSTPGVDGSSAGTSLAETSLFRLVAPQYADYASWQRRVRDSDSSAADLGWWSRRLSGLPQFSTFPPDHLGDNATGATRPFCWDAELTRSIETLARKEGVTVYMMLLAACAAVLRAHTSQSDLVLGSPMGLRERTEFENVIGPFVNLLLLRLDLSDDPTFSELLLRARNALLDAHDHREAPFEAIVERLNPVRSFARSPLFQVSVVHAQWRRRRRRQHLEWRLNSGS